MAEKVAKLTEEMNIRLKHEMAISGETKKTIVDKACKMYLEYKDSERRLRLQSLKIKKEN